MALATYLWFQTIVIVIDTRLFLLNLALPLTDKN